MNRSWWAGVAVVFIVAWAAWLLVSPVVAAGNASGWPLAMVAVTYHAGGLICHQLPERSPHIRGVQTAVCARCLGLYEGAAAGSLIGVGWYRRRRRQGRGGGGPLLVARWLLVGTAGPTAVLWVIEHTTGVAVGNSIRLALALPLGAVVSAVVVAWIAGMPFDDAANAAKIE